MTLGEKIQALRKQKNISQEQLADMMNISRQAVSKWELNESVPDVENLVQLSEVLDVSLDYLVKDAPLQTQAQTPAQTSTPARTDDDDDDDDWDDDEEDEEWEENKYEIGGWRIDITNAIWPVAVLLFFITDIGIIPLFISAWILSEAVELYRGKKLRLSPYTVAAALFLFLGFVMGIWNNTWLLFIAAWAVDSMFVKDKRKKRQQ